MATTKTSDYHRVNNNVDDDGFEANERIDIEAKKTHKQIISRPFLFGILLGFVLAILTSYIISLKARDTCIRKTSAWSPALDIYDDNEWALQRFDGTLRKNNEFRGPPSDEIDNAWEEITRPKESLIRLSKDQLDRLNASVFAAEYTESMGGGYMATIEVFHQIHCVNMLRKATYMEHYLPKIEEWKDQETLRLHLDHCADILRQKLMCDPDLGMVTYVWVKGLKQALPDFNTMHKCRPFSKTVDWMVANSVHGINISDIERVPGASEKDTRP